jgi:hypothetical protein
MFCHLSGCITEWLRLERPGAEWVPRGQPTDLAAFNPHMGAITLWGLARSAIIFSAAKMTG